jgi:hypothetical protein
MKHVKWSYRMCAIGAACALLLAAPPATAQNLTTGALSGVVTDPSGGVLPGVNVVATHTPTGTKYEAITGADGRFEIPNVRVGPYTVAATLSGFKDQTQPVTVTLGETRTVDLKLAMATMTESVTVTAQAQTIDTTNAGTGSNIPTQEINSLPTIDRSITDIARTNPLFNPSTLGSSGAKALSVAGQHNRYNNMQIDGAVNNDLFGLADTGTPGGQTGSQPISFDVLSEMQLVVTSYDVRQGGFAGGGLNVVTRSGSNAFTGDGYFYARNQGLIGKIPGIATVATPSPLDTKVGPFTQQQGGASVGGPLMHDKAFFFGNFDLGRQNTPSGFSVSGATGQQWGASDTALVQQALSIFQAQYGFNPGGLDEFSKPNNSNKVFVRTDFNLSPKNQLVVRVNYVDGLAYVGTPTTTQYLLPDRYYSISDKTLSSVAQLNTSLSNTAFNEFRITYQRERNLRGDQPGNTAFPSTEVDFPDGNNMVLGTETSSQANALNQDIVELNDDVTWVKGKHTVTVGTHNEFFKFYNLFIQNFYGTYRFSSVANLQAGLAQSFAHNFSNDPSNPQLSAQFSVQQFGVYAGDQWRAKPNLTVTYGIRFDAPHFPDVPHANPLAVTDFGLRTDIAPAPKMWSPRIGVNWDLSHGSDNRQQIRAGIGSYAGRTPYVWLSNNYGNTGVDFTALSVSFNANNKIPFVANPNAQPTSITGGAAGKQTINLIDPNYKYPQLLRGNLAYDRALGFWGLVSTSEFVWSKTLNNVLYKDLNFVQTGTLPDGRFSYTKFDNSINDAVLLTNTHQGDSETVVFKVERPFRNGFMASASYLYNRARSVSDGGAFVALSTWRDQYVTQDANNPTLATSNYQTGNRVNLTGSVPIPLPKGLTSTASFFYNGQTGQPYSLVFNGDANGDTTTFNDIAFIPSSASQVVVTNGTYAQLDAYLSSDPAAKNNRGVVPNRNTGTSPWTNDLDFRYAVNVSAGKRAKVEVTFDILNMLNLLNKNWGWVYFPNFYSPQTLGTVSGEVDKATGLPVINVATIASPNFLGTFTRDDLRSRWSAQWGLRLRF